MTRWRYQDMTLQMGIIKIEIKIPELVGALELFKKNKIAALQDFTNEIKQSVSDTFNQLLNIEMDLFLGQPDQSNNRRNGVYEREYTLKGIGTIRLRMPRDRNMAFKSDLVPAHEQMDPRLKEDLAMLHLAGISNRVLSMVSKRILGIKVSSSTIQNSMQVLSEGALKWLNRPIDKSYWALFIDGTNFHIQRRGSTEKEPTLVVLGLDARNTFSILTLQSGRKDSSECWRTVFDDLIKRGLDPAQVQIGIMDGLPGLESKFKETFLRSVTGRCWVHSKRNTMNKVPRRFESAFNLFLDKMMNADSAASARDEFNNLKKLMNDEAGKAIHCIEKDLDSLLSHYSFDKSLWRTLRTTNPIERVNKELKRRTKTMEGVGEKTLDLVLAFTAMRLEYHWQRIPVDSVSWIKLTSKKHTEQMDEVLENLIH